MGTRQPSMLILMGGDLESVDLEPMRRTLKNNEKTVLCHPRCNGL